MPDGRLRREWAWTIDGSQTSAAPVSPADCVRLRSNAAGTALEVSYDGAAYTTFSGGSTAWSALTAPTGDLTLSHGDYKTVFNFDATQAEDCFLIQSANNAAGSGVVLYVATQGASTTKAPLRVDAKGSAALAVNVNGYLGIGTASVDSNAFVHVAASSTFKVIVTHNDDSLYLHRAVASAASGNIIFRRSRGTFSSPSALASGDAVGSLSFQGSVETGAGSDEAQLGTFAMLAARDLSEADYAAGFRWQTKDSAESVGLRNRMWLTSLGYLGIGQNLAVTDVTHRLTVSGDVKFNLGSDATGDIWYRAATTGTFTRLGIGSTGHVLTVAGGLPSWAAPAAQKWNTIANPDGNQALTMAAYTSTWTWNATTSTNDLFVVTNTTDDTGTGALVAINTPGTSNAKTPFKVTAQTNATFEINSGGSATLARYHASLNSSFGISRARGTLASPTAVQASDSLGSVTFGGQYSSTVGQITTGAGVYAEAAATFSATNNAQTDIYIATKGSGNSVVHIAARFTSEQKVGIGSDIAHSDVTHQLTVVGDVKLNLGSDATGDIWYRAASTGTFTRLGIGASGALLVVSSGLPSWSTTLVDDVRITFNPGSNNAGLNVGALAGNPSSPSNGDIWYNSSGNALNARINGATVSLGAGSSAWSALTDPTGNLALTTMAAYTTAFTWNATTSTNDLFTLQNTSNDTGTGSLVAINTPGSTNAKTPLKITAQTNGTFEVNTVGSLTVARYATAANASIAIARSRGTLASPTAVQASDSLGSVTFGGQYDSTVGHITTSAGIYGEAAATFSATNDAQTDIYIATKGSGNSAAHIVARFTSDQRLGVGYDIAHSDVTDRLTVVGSAKFTLTTSETFIVTSDAVSTSLDGHAWGASIAPLFALVRGRGTKASPTAVQSGDSLGSFNWAGQYDSTVGHYTSAASIKAEAQQTFAATNDKGADLVFNTSYTGSSAVHSGIRLQHNQYVLIAKDSSAGDAGAQLHVKAATDTDVGFIVNTASSTATADIARFQHNGTTKFLLDAISGGAVNTVVGSGALATNATDGFIWLPSGAGTPTGTPSTYSGLLPVYIDSTNKKLWINFTGTGWLSVTLA